MKNSSHVSKIWKRTSSFLVAITLVISALGGLRSAYFWIFGHPLSLLDKEIIFQHQTKIILNKTYVTIWASDDYPDITISLTNTTNVDAYSIKWQLINANQKVALKRTREMHFFSHKDLSLSPHSTMDIPVGSALSYYNAFKNRIVQCNEENMGVQRFGENDICLDGAINITYKSPYGQKYSDIYPLKVVINKNILSR